MVHPATTAQSSACTQNHLWVLHKLITVSKHHNSRDLKLKILHTQCFTSNSNHNAILIPSTLCMIFQHNLVMAVPQKQSGETGLSTAIPN